MSDPNTRDRATSSWVIGLGAAALVAVIVLGFCAFYDTPAEFWTYGVPGTLTGAGTIGLAFATVLMARAARRDSDEARSDRDLARAERDRERAQNEVALAEAQEQVRLQNRRAQAEMVTCEAAQSAYDDKWMSADERSRPPLGTVVSLVIVENQSSGMLRDVQFVWSRRRIESATAEVKLSELATRSVGDVGANTSFGYVRPRNLGLNATDVLKVAVFFTDEESVRWCRDSAGSLREIDPI